MTLIYQIRIRGRLSPTLLAQFEQPDLLADVGAAETVLHGRFADQAALYGLLRRVEALGLELLGLRRLTAGARAARAPGPARRLGGGRLPRACDTPPSDAS